MNLANVEYQRGNYKEAYELISEYKFDCKQYYHQFKADGRSKKVDAFTMEQFCVASFCQAIVLLAMNQRSRAAKKLQYVIVNGKNHKYIRQAKILIKLGQHAKP